MLREAAAIAARSRAFVRGNRLHLRHRRRMRLLWPKRLARHGELDRESLLRFLGTRRRGAVDQRQLTFSVRDSAPREAAGALVAHASPKDALCRTQSDELWRCVSTHGPLLASRRLGGKIDPQHVARMQRRLHACAVVGSEADRDRMRGDDKHSGRKHEQARTQHGADSSAPADADTLNTAPVMSETVKAVPPVKAVIKAVRGTRDLLPPETELWNHIDATARRVFARYNFGEIRTPIFEDTQLFARGVGEETDIVSKEMYTWEDKARAQSEKAQSLTLRPENTAGVVRAYIEHKLGEQGLLQKLYYIGPQFRRERPQKGRYRQFFQIGAEVIGPPSAGSESPLRDAEVLEMLATLLNELGITGWRLLINSVGTPADRPRYIATLRDALQPVVGQMCADCQRRAETNPLRVLDCKHPEDQPIIATLAAHLGFAG